LILICGKVKLADILLKTILPVSFLESWPPKCLAIQFSTTQYIPCRHNADADRGMQPSLNLVLCSWCSFVSDLQWLLQPQRFTALWQVPSYSAWWQRHAGCK